MVYGKKNIMNECLKDECEYQDEEGKCILLECIYYMDKETVGDIKYHRAVDEGEIR